MDTKKTSSRISYDIPCVVCGDYSSGKHYGVFACDGCAGFFKRSVRRQRRYSCTASPALACPVDRARRNRCRACRYQRCRALGMDTGAVQHERGPRAPKPAPSPALSEAAARLLLVNVQWARCLPAFEALPLEDRVHLLENSWRELFVLGAAQWLCWSGRVEDDELSRVMQYIRGLGADEQELAALRAVALLGCAEDVAPQGPVALLQHHALNLLRAVSSKPDVMLEALRLARTVPSVAIQRLFANSVVGNVPLHRLISDIYVAQSTTSAHFV